MNNCLNCGKEIKQKEGARERKFCENQNACKQAYHNKHKKQPKYVKLSSFQALKDMNAKLMEQLENERKKQNKAISEAFTNPATNTMGIDKITQPYSSNDTDKPIRSNFKDGIEYSIALAEWKEKQK